MENKTTSKTNKQQELNAFKAGMDYAALQILPLCQDLDHAQIKIMIKTLRLKSIPANFTSFHNS
jgi:pyruvate/oxaloacetate carboxyltransferase